MSHITSYCQKGRPWKQCDTQKYPQNKCIRRPRCLMWHVHVADDVGDNTHCHVMQSPHQQQWMTRQKLTRHVISLGVHAAPHVCKGTNEKTCRRGTARKKLGDVASRCRPRVTTWTLCWTMFYVTSLKKCVGNRHVLTCLSRVFLLSDMTNFRWRPGGELRCQSERALPFFLTSQKMRVSYSEGSTNWHMGDEFLVDGSSFYWKVGVVACGWGGSSVFWYFSIYHILKVATTSSLLKDKVKSSQGHLPHPTLCQHEELMGIVISNLFNLK